MLAIADSRSRRAHGHLHNEDESPHTVTSKQSGAFDSGTIEGGKRGPIILADPGAYAYFCTFHPL